MKHNTITPNGPVLRLEQRKRRYEREARMAQMRLYNNLDYVQRNAFTLASGEIMRSMGGTSGIVQKVLGSVGGKRSHSDHSGSSFWSKYADYLLPILGLFIGGKGRLLTFGSKGVWRLIFKVLRGVLYLFLGHKKPFIKK